MNRCSQAFKTTIEFDAKAVLDNIYPRPESVGAHELMSSWGLTTLVECLGSRIGS